MFPAGRVVSAVSLILCASTAHWWRDTSFCRGHIPAAGLHRSLSIYQSQFWPCAVDQTASCLKTTLPLLAKSFSLYKMFGDAKITFCRVYILSFLSGEKSIYDLMIYAIHFSLAHMNLWQLLGLFLKSGIEFDQSNVFVAYNTLYKSNGSLSD